MRREFITAEENIILERTKKRRQYANEVIEDRLSDLPDGVILQILSLLDTKQVVRTCVLSKRWEHLWKRISTLILHSSRFSYVKQFTTFVSKILTLRDSSTALRVLDVDRNGNFEPRLLKGPFGSRVLEGRGGEGRGGEIFNLKCLVQFLEGKGRGGEGSKSL
ncbi:F-box/RNI/FBD-like domain protein [Medicago truncatula]|uniref:F-box/RNI/FBD-like domain protein n=1 Tax=Medicago truncatula TaxID=3880 RepID=G7JH80_MEDTR|nr:F-box/RNI/FBD-like domain protein [Medicago truncatula]